MRQTANVPQGPMPRLHAGQTIGDALTTAPIKCRVTIHTEGGAQTYDGLFASTGVAAIDAQERFGLRACAVSVRALP